MSGNDSLTFSLSQLDGKGKSFEGKKEKCTHLLEGMDNSLSSETVLDVQKQGINTFGKNIEMKILNTESSINTENKPEESFEEFLERMKENAQISQAIGKTYDVFLFRFETRVVFNFFYFLKFFFYHILFEFTLGPLIGLILIPIEGLNMVRNMQFLNFNWYTPFMHLQYLGAGPNIALVIYFKYYYTINGNYVDHMPHFHGGEVLLSVIILFLRILIISFRYGYTSKSQLANRYLPLIPNLKREYIISGWRHVDMETIDDEIILSLVRKQIEIDMFVINMLTWYTRPWIERMTTDNYHQTHDKKFLDKMVMKEYKHSQKEKQLLKEIRRVKFDRKLYAKLKPFFEKIKKEKLEKLSSSLNYSSLFSQKSSIKIEINENEEKKCYKTIIKKIASNLNSLSSKKQMEPRLIGYGNLLVNEKTFLQSTIPFYLMPVTPEYLDFDFPCRLFAREIFYMSRNGVKSLFTITIKFLTISHAFIPVIYRLITGDPPFGSNFMEVFMIILNILVMTIALYFSIMFIEVGGNDYARREYCMKALSSLISPDKSLLPLSLRIFPTINIFCPNNMKSWLNMRLILMDIGLRYTKRVELYTSCFLFTYLLLVIGLLLGNFHILRSFNFENYPITFLLGYTEAFIFTVVFYRMILVGVSLNDYFQIHINELVFMKSSFKHILLNWQVFLEMSSCVDPYLHKTKEFYYICQDYHNKCSPEKVENDRMYGKFIPKDDEEFKSHLNVLIENLDNTIERIDLEQNIAPVKLLGIKLTSDLLTQFYVTVITLLISLGQYLVNTYIWKSGPSMI